MYDNIVFKNNDQPEQVPQTPPQPVGAPPIPEPVTPQVPATPQVVAGETVSAPQDGSPLPPKPARSFSLKKALVIAGVVLFISLLGFLVFRYAGSFFGGKEEEKVTLTYWGLWEEPAVMNSVLSDFTKENPNITVNYVKKDIKQYRQGLATQISNGTGPDIFRFHNSWAPLLRGVLQPLSSDVISPDEFKSLYYPVVLKDVVRNGAIHGIPMGLDTVALFVNTELFQASGAQVPKTWNEFVQVSKELTVKDSDRRIRTAGAALGTYDNITHAPDVISVLMAQNGTDFSNFPSTTANTTQALQFYTDFAKGEGSVWDETLDPSMVAFAKGNLAMYFGYSWDIFGIKELNPDLAFTTHPVPALPGREITVASYWIEGVSNKSQHQKEAMLLMNYLAQKETAQKFYQESAKIRLFGEPYARRDLGETLRSNSLVYPFVSQAEKAVSSYFASDTYDEGLNGPLNVYLGNSVRSILNNSSAESAVETLTQGVQQVFGRYGQ